MNKRSLFLPHFLMVEHGERGLDIISLAAAVADEIYFQLFPDRFAAAAAFGIFNDAHVHVKAAEKELVVYDVLHNMVFFLLAEVKLRVPKAHVGKVILERGSNVFLSFYVVAFRLADEVCVKKIADIRPDSLVVGVDAAADECFCEFIGVGEGAHRRRENIYERGESVNRTL